MRLTTRSLVFAGTFVVAAVVGVAMSLNRTAAVPPGTAAPYADDATLTAVGIQLSPVLSSDVAKISGTEALRLAIVEAGLEREPSSPYSIQLTRLTDLNYGEDGKPLIVDHRLVWLVRFTGLPQPVFGPPRESGAPTPRQATELNVVIDATTGVVIESFSFK